MRFAFIDAEKATYSVRMLCRVLQVSTSGFYAWKAREPSDRQKEDQVLSAKVVEIFHDSRQTYGSPRIQAELVEEGHSVARKRVARLMAEQGLQAVIPRRFRLTTDSNHDHPMADDYNISYSHQTFITEGSGILVPFQFQVIKEYGMLPLRWNLLICSR